MTEEGGGLGVVVVHYGRPEPTVRCIRSITGGGATPPPVVLIDNGPAGRAEGLASGLPTGLDLEVLPCFDNPGFGGGANRGVEVLSRRKDLEGWVVLNHDVELLPGFLEAAARALGRPGVGAAGGPIHLGGPDGPLWYAGGRFRRLTGTVVQSRSPADAERAHEVGFIPGTAIAVSRQAWQDVGGFDPAFFLYHEDLDLCLRLRRAGWRLGFEPGMAVVHHLGGATGSGERSALYLEEMAATRLRPHRSRLYRLYLAALHTPYVLLRALKLAVEDRGRGLGRARALLAGHRRALAGLFDA